MARPGAAWPGKSKAGNTARQGLARPGKARARQGTRLGTAWLGEERGSAWPGRAGHGKAGDW